MASCLLADIYYRRKLLLICRRDGYDDLLYPVLLNRALDGITVADDLYTLDEASDLFVGIIDHTANILMKEITCHDLFYKHIAGLTRTDYHDIGTDLFIPVPSYYHTDGTVTEPGHTC